MARKHKYMACKVVTPDGQKFDSKKEHRRWGELQLLERAGEITGLTRDKLHCTFLLHGCKGAVVCKYTGDYRYQEVGNAKVVIEDCKGIKTPVYRLKRKLFIAEYGLLFEHRES